MTKLKKIVLIAPLLALVAATAVADEDKDKVRDAEVSDRYTNITESVPYTKRDCVTVDVPIYGWRQSGNNAAGGALLGMILGGIGGKALTGQDNGAVAGAIMGGIVGADQGAGKPRGERVVTGYTTEQRCTDVTYYRDVIRTVYSHSIITFDYNGLSYTLQFDK